MLKRILVTSLCLITIMACMTGCNNETTTGTNEGVIEESTDVAENETENMDDENEIKSTSFYFSSDLLSTDAIVANRPEKVLNTEITLPISKDFSDFNDYQVKEFLNKDFEQCTWEDIYVNNHPVSKLVFGDKYGVDASVGFELHAPDTADVHNADKHIALLTFDFPVREIDTGTLTSNAEYIDNSVFRLVFVDNSVVGNDEECVSGIALTEIIDYYGKPNYINFNYDEETLKEKISNFTDEDYVIEDKYIEFYYTLGWIYEDCYMEVNVLERQYGEKMNVDVPYQIMVDSIAFVSYDEATVEAANTLNKRDLFIKIYDEVVNN
ncbi:MAG: hypothetical protein J6A73_00940 [Lachnospiraceae bacterium]|nr:hypothetical protein [Lachnospiraceae bacterium]